MEIQAIAFPRNKYSTIECRIYLKKLNLYPIMRVDRTDTDYIYILSKMGFTHHITKSVGNVKFCYGYF